MAVHARLCELYVFLVIHQRVRSMSSNPHLLKSMLESLLSLISCPRYVGQRNHVRSLTDKELSSSKISDFPLSTLKDSQSRRTSLGGSWYYSKHGTVTKLATEVGISWLHALYPSPDISYWRRLFRRALGLLTLHFSLLWVEITVYSHL